MPTMIRKYLSSRGKRIVLICKHCGNEFETLQLKDNTEVLEAAIQYLRNS